jgi:quinoprotein glucose dehydrogenase
MDKSKRLRQGALVAFGLAALIGSRPAPVTAQRDARVGEWRVYTGNPGATRYSPLDQINKDNINDVTVAWRWQSAADRSLQASSPTLRASRNEETPIMANGVLYTATPLGLVAALDPATGETRWVYDPEGYKSGRPNNVGFVQRGLAYWTDGSAERVLTGTGDAYLVSIDVKTGKPDPAFGKDGKVDLTTGIRAAVRATNFSARSPLVAGDVIIMGSSIADVFTQKETPPGDVQAFDIRTGRKLWAFHTVPHKGEFGYETWLEESAEYSGSTNVWTGMSYDPELDYVYLPTSTPTNDYYGGQRLGNNLFAESLVCLEAKTGKRVWHYQAVHHGLWDYDFPTAPILGDITVGGRRIKAVMQISKQAFTYVFDRKTGEPVWPIVERAVPQSKVPRERSAPTQPFPTKPPAFDLQGSTEQNVMTYTPELRKRALTQLQKYVHGPLFTPPSLQGTVTIPGNFGSASWGGGSFDPDTGMLYVPSRMMVHLQRIVAGGPDETVLFRLGGPTPPPTTTGTTTATAPGATATTTTGQTPPSAPTTATPPTPPADPLMVDDLWLFKPPYSRVTAINMNRGEHAWMTPLGNGPRNHPLLKDLNLPPLGDGVRGLPLLTKGLLFVSTVRVFVNGVPQPPESGYAAKYLEPNSERKLLYVFDKDSGKVLREIELDGRTAAPPMTYMHQGKQYVVVGVGAGATTELIALSLPGPSSRQ